METSYNYEEGNKQDYHQSRKRPYNNEDEHEKNDGRTRDSKRSSHSGGQISPLIKLLIPNYAAGAIIGKGGSNIGDLQNSYGAKIRISPSREYYPGTEERIVIITGEVNQIVDMHNYVMEKVHIDSNSDGPRSRSDDSERGQKVKIVVPNSTAGLLIGRGGTAIKSLQEETKSKIVISSRDEAAVQGERIITISGNTEQRTEAARQVIVKIASDAENMANKNLTYTGVSHRNGSAASFGSAGLELNQTIPGGLNALSSVIGNLQHHSKSSQSIVGSLSSNPLSSLGQSGIVGQLGLGNASGGLGSLGLSGGSAAFGGLGLTQNVGSIVSSIKTTVTIQMEIPDILVGAILGKQGKTVHEFIQFSGAKIQFSAKNDFAPGTTDRILTIQGDLNQTQIAYFLINQKIAQAENELASGLQTRR